MNRTHRPWTRRASALVVALAVVGATASMASASSPTLVTRSGDCSGPSHWTLTLRKSGINLRIKYAVAGGASGQTWNVFADQNDAFLFAVSRTSGVGGTFAVNRVVDDLPGVDAIHVEAQNRRTGEICGGSASL